MKKILLLLILTWSICQAKVWLPSILSDNMVLQQESTASIWGWTTATSEKITLTVSWEDKVYKTKAYQGKWSIEIPTPKAGGPFSLEIEGHEKITLNNVLIGEVWICSGQSNMEWTPRMGLMNADEEIAAANYPNIRFFTLPKRKADNPQEDIPGSWAECSPETMKDFSSVAYFFGRKLHKNMEVPIGLINSNWGGTPIEVWIQKELIEADKELATAQKKLKPVAWWPEESGVCYNAMIHPLINFDIAGALWYQGESNRVNAFSYYTSFPLLIESWRKAWGKDFPFYFVQIAPFKYKSEQNMDAAVVRDAQLHTMQKVPHTGMAVTNDIGNLNNIHPTNKQEVGRRLALWALAKTYGTEDVSFSGPIYSSMELKGNTIALNFDFANQGLMKKGENLKEFYIAGADQVFYPAKAEIVGHQVHVFSSKVSKPLAVRFAFSNTAIPNLYNKEGLPASAFRTDDWKIMLE